MKHPKDRPVHLASHERPTGRRQWMCLCLLLLFTTAAWANDGSYFTSGNQLLPLVESDIRVQREVLTLSWGDDGMADVDVYYEFFNPGAQKSILMGFEADPPSYMDTLDRSGAHPYISDFTVAMNGKPLAVATSIVRSDTLYLDQGHVRALDLSEYEVDEARSGDYPAIISGTPARTTTCPSLSSTTSRPRSAPASTWCATATATRWKRCTIDDMT